MIDFKDNTYAKILAAMLAAVSDDVDKREESLINTALGPAAYALEDAYIDLSRIQSGAHVQSAVGEDLSLTAKDIGISRKPATAAVRRGVFNADVPVGSRFSTNEANSVDFTVSAVSDGAYELTCETAGTVGNRYTGDLVAITYIEGLTIARVTDVLTAGEDEEADDHLRARCIAHLNSTPFGGNVASYLEYVGALTDVGSVQIYPTWNGGGTVKLSITGADGMPAGAALIDAVQTAVDPTQNAGAGYGIAPIGACVTVSTPTAAAINVSAAVTVAGGYTLSQVTQDIKDAVEAYVASVRGAWAAPTVPGTANYASVIYRARVMTAILLVTGVVNVTDLLLNGADADVQLTETGAEQQLPVMGEVTLTGGN